MKYTTDKEDAQMTLATIAYEHNVPYNTINTASELLDWFDVPPDIYVTSVFSEDPIVELIWEKQNRNYLRISIKQRTIAILDEFDEQHAKSQYQYNQTIQNCIDVYNEHYKELKQQFSIYEESF